MSVIPKALRDRMTPIVQLKLAKSVAPGIFENATPKIHPQVLDFVNTAGTRAAVVMSRGFAKSTLLNKVHIFRRVFLLHEPFTIIVSENASKAQSFLRDIKRMIACWEEGYWDYNLDHACAEFGGCVFKRVCLSEDPKPWLETSFERRVWSPLTRIEEKAP